MKLDPAEKLFAFILIVLLAYKHAPDSINPHYPSPDDPPAPGKLWMLIVEETADRSKLPHEQQLAFAASDVRQYLDTHCAQENGHPTYRIFDNDQPVSGESKAWQTAFDELKDKPTPAIKVWNGGRRSYVGDMPKDTDSLLKLLKKYGGA